MIPILYQAYMDSPLGRCQAIASENGLISLAFNEDSLWVSTRIQHYYPNHPLLDEGDSKRSKVLNETKCWLENYFLKNFKQLQCPTLEMRGNPFVVSVWHSLLNIAPGHTESYGQIARQILKPKASRAVGQAVGANPFAIIVPCHRIIGGSGQLTGYRGGLDRKIWLLEHEGVKVKKY